MITQEQYEAACAQKDAADEVIRAFYLQKENDFKARLESGKPFTDDELVYAAFTLCPCGHGLAYPKACGMSHYWDCSAILKGIADKTVKHTGRLPFAFYSVKSEEERSAGGSTTRGVFRPQPIS